MKPIDWNHNILPQMPVNYSELLLQTQIAMLSNLHSVYNSLEMPHPILQYQTHKIENGKHGIYYPIVFNDVMGLEESSGKGVHKDDIINALKGHVKEGHKVMWIK